MTDRTGGKKPLLGGALPIDSGSPTGRATVADPDLQNFPGTLAHALEMAWARYGAPPPSKPRPR